MTSTPSRSRNRLVVLFFAVTLTLCLNASALAKCGQTSKYMPKPDQAGCSQGGLNYAVYGAGKPLLAIHGLGASMYSWREFVKVKNTFPGYQIFLIDLKGAGNSKRPYDGDYSILTQRDLVLEFIHEKQLKDLTIVGNSYGGAVSLLLAIHFCVEEPGWLTKLILIDSGGYPEFLPWYLKLMRLPVLGWLALHILTPRQSAKTVLKNAYYNECLITPEQIAAYAAPIASRGGRYVLLETAKGVLPDCMDEIVKQYPRINVPTAILWGHEDRVMPLEVGEKLHKAIGTSTLDQFYECGHVPQEEKPAETICWMKKVLGLPAIACPQ